MKSRLRAREAGFSFVELLVTVIIAGIAFAAMVPLFVGAEEKSAGDNMRNIAMQLARDKIEKIRQLDYDQIETTTGDHLGSATFADGQYSTSWTAQIGATSKVFHISYNVTLLPRSTPAPSPGLEKYKQVTVVVTWDAPPRPVDPAILSTVVYKQYAGPAISSWEIDSSVLEEVQPDTYWITGAPVTVDVWIAPEDIASMNALLRPINDTNKRKMGYVRFSVSSANGTGDIAIADVYEEYNAEPGHYQFVWDNSNTADGIYTIGVTAYSSSQQEGTSFSKGFNVAVKVPPKPTDLSGTVGHNVVSLTWAGASIGDFKKYELWRSTPDLAHWVLYVPSITTSPSYTDTGVTDGTDYYYKVRVIDNDGNASPFSDVAGPLRPAAVSDTTPPTTPGSFTVTRVTGQAAITLSWAASSDPGTPSTGVKGYTLQRKIGAGAWSQVLSADTFSQLNYTDTGLAWNTTYTYRVQAVDGVNLASPWTAELSATTVTQPKWTLTVNNTNNSSSITVYVQSVTTGLWWTYHKNADATSGTSQGAAACSIAKNKSVDYQNLPQDLYNVTTSGGGAQAVTLSSSQSVSFSQ